MTFTPARRAVLAGLLTLPLAARAATTDSDLRDFGAVGDGVTDDSAALQRAIRDGGDRLRVPPGRYLVRQPLVLRSGQTWQGAGADQSILLTPQEPGVQPFNLLTSDTPVSDIDISDIGLKGSLVAQGTSMATLRPGDGQRPFGIYLRQGVERFSLRRCRIEGFGIPGKKIGGGIALGALPSSRTAPVAEIVIQDCLFSGNGNVPGLYIAGGGAGGRDISVTGCRFTGVGGETPPQNAVYILGTPDAPMTRVRVADCGFLAETPLDTGVELNWVEDFEVSDLSIRFRTGAPGAVGVLLRDGTRRGRIRRIALETELPGTFGLALVDFDDAPRAPIDQIDIDEITVIGPFERAIAIDRGSQNIRLRRWTIGANAAGGASQGLRLAACRDILAQEGQITAARYPVRFAAQTSGIQLVRLNLEYCGGDGPLFHRETAMTTTHNLTLADIAVLEPRPGTDGLIDPALGSLP